MSPLGIITGYAKNVASHLSRGPGNEESLSALKQIQDNAARIFKLVMGFLDVSKTEAGKVDTARQPVQLNRLIREVGQQQMGDLRKKNLSLSVDLEDALPEVSGDEDQLERVLWNLLGNAIKFTPMGGRIAVSSQQQNDNVCVSVNDTGMGIPEPELPLLFSEFRRLNGAGAVEGTGLGLFIVKTVVEAHGGSVEAQSQGGHGTTFTIRFPVRT
jgi:signal transduction histidine kinase